MFFWALQRSLSGNHAMNTRAILGERSAPSEGTRISFPSQEAMLSTTYGIKQEVPNLDSRGVDLTRIFWTNLALSSQALHLYFGKDQKMLIDLGIRG